MVYLLIRDFNRPYRGFSPDSNLLSRLEIDSGVLLLLTTEFFRKWIKTGMPPELFNKGGIIWMPNKNVLKKTMRPWGNALIICAQDVGGLVPEPRVG